MEKIIQLPNKESQIISPGDITEYFRGTITVWNKNELIGFIYWEHNDNEWYFIEGIQCISSDDNISYFLEQYPNYIFKVNEF